MGDGRGERAQRDDSDQSEGKKEKEKRVFEPFFLKRAGGKGGEGEGTPHEILAAIVFPG